MNRIKWCLFLLLMGCGGQSDTKVADEWTYRLDIIPLGDSLYDLPMVINGSSFDCLLDTGAGAPLDAMWIRRDIAQQLGLNRQGDEFHYYTGLTVSSGAFVRTDVFSYEFDRSWDDVDPCLVGKSFFVGMNEFNVVDIPDDPSTAEDESVHELRLR